MTTIGEPISRVVADVTTADNNDPEISSHNVESPRATSLSVGVDS